MGCNPQMQTGQGFWRDVVIWAFRRYEGSVTPQCYTLQDKWGEKGWGGRRKGMGCSVTKR